MLTDFKLALTTRGEELKDILGPLRSDIMLSNPHSQLRTSYLHIPLSFTGEAWKTFTNTTAVRLLARLSTTDIH